MSIQNSSPIYLKEERVNKKKSLHSNNIGSENNETHGKIGLKHQRENSKDVEVQHTIQKKRLELAQTTLPENKSLKQQRENSKDVEVQHKIQKKRLELAHTILPENKIIFMKELQQVLIRYESPENRRMVKRELQKILATTKSSSEYKEKIEPLSSFNVPIAKLMAQRETRKQCKVTCHKYLQHNFREPNKDHMERFLRRKFVIVQQRFSTRKSAWKVNDIMYILYKKIFKHQVLSKHRFLDELRYRKLRYQTINPIIELTILCTCMFKVNKYDEKLTIQLEKLLLKRFLRM